MIPNTHVMQRCSDASLMMLQSNINIQSWHSTAQHNAVQYSTLHHLCCAQIFSRWLQVTWLSSLRSEVHSTVFANSVNVLVTWGLPVTIFHSTCIFCVYGMALYWPTLQVYVCVYVCLPVSGVPWQVLLQYSIMLSLFFIIECGIVRFLCAMRVFSSGIILIL